MFRRLLIVNFISCYCLLLVVSNAFAADVFTIRGVEVKEKASSELSAKKKALAAGQRNALGELLKRLTLQSDYARLPVPTDALTGHMVRDFSVSEEKLGGGRYHAKLSVRFKPKTVRALLRRMDIPFAETASRPFVVLPVMISGKTPLLWDEPNPWFDIWGEVTAPDGLLPLLMPERELSDIALVTAEQALAGNIMQLHAVAKKYQSRGVVVPSAEFSEVAVPPAGFGEENKIKIHRAEIKLVTFYSTGKVNKEVSAYESQPGMTSYEFQKQLALVLIQQLRENWKTANLLTTGTMNSLVAVVPLSNLEEWIDVKDKLRNVATVKHFGIRRMSIRESEIIVQFQGDPKQLRVAFEQNGLNLSYAEEQNLWMLQRLSR